MEAVQREEYVAHYDEGDDYQAPFIIRVSGTCEFVSEIHGRRIEFCEGWDNPGIVEFPTLEAALEAVDQVWELEPMHFSIETVLGDI
tara:strand:- start:316 stop:576 length:261 start_codon:yes stop_codon:yes gene_type:complete